MYNYNIILLRIFTYFIFLFLITKIQNIIEKKNITKGCLSGILIIEKRSKKIFKIFLIIILLMIVIENNFYQLQILKYSKHFFWITGIIIFILGFSLRILAIRALGKFWSFNVELKPNHSIIKRGIYKYLNHPGYLGNIYIVGMALFMGAIFTAILSIIFISVFAFFRISLEEKYILEPLRLKSH